MRFQVPQFIEVEDKIFGPLSLKQFIYLAGGGGIALGLFVLIPYRLVAILLALPFVVLAVALAFYKMNNRPFVYMLESIFRYFVGSRLYIWKKEEKKVEAKQADAPSSSPIFVPALSDSKLKDLNWSLDVSGKGVPPKPERTMNKV